MSAFEVLRAFGTAALVRFTAALAVFVVLHLVLRPVELLAELLTGAMRRVDAYLIDAQRAGRWRADRGEGGAHVAA